MIKNSDNLLAIVTGASSGIGKSITLKLASVVKTLCLVGRNLTTLQDASKAVSKTGTTAHCFKADLLRDSDIYRLKDEIQHNFGFVDILIHSAGVIAMGRIEEAPVEDLDLQYRVNLRAPYLLTQLLLPMIKARHGQIVFINSSAGIKKNRPNIVQYAPTKHALRAMADCLRAEVQSDGVRVISIYPGSTATPMQEYVQRMEGRVYLPENFIQPEEIAQVVIDALALPRKTKVADIKC